MRLRTVTGVWCLLICAGLCVGGCGAASKHDEFVGTWEQPRTLAAPLIITRTSGGYRGIIAYTTARTLVLFKRHGDELEGVARLGSDEYRVEAVYSPVTRRLTFRNATVPGGPMSTPVEMIRTSESTAIPSESPF